MGDLDNSPLFDQRHIDFLRAILNDRPLNPLSGVEQKFLRQAVIIKELNREHFDGKLIAALQKHKKYTAVQVVVQFLVEAREHDMMRDALELLDHAYEDHKGGSLQDLLKILNEIVDLPAAWAVTLYGEEVDDRHTRETYTMPSGLNLDAMRDFK